MGAATGERARHRAAGMTLKAAYLGSPRLDTAGRQERGFSECPYGVILALMPTTLTTAYSGK